MDLYKCKVGDVVVTGDSYGSSPCVCIKDLGESEEKDCPFHVVTFLDLTNGGVHESGGILGYQTDDCMLVDRVKPAQVEVIKKAWGVV